jgi:DNA repair exonuclease SbcCD nuclease subunit
MALKILHLADLHLDHAFTDAGMSADYANRRRNGLRQALQHALVLAKDRQVNAVTIGGDLYEAALVSPDTAQFLVQQFAQAAPIRIFIAPGQSDPYTGDSVYTYIDWPGNVTIFKEPKLTSVSLSDDMNLWGLGYDSAGFTHTGLTDFEVSREQKAVLLMHGEFADPRVPEPRRSGVTFEPDEVSEAGFQLVLLGGDHIQLFSPENRPVVCNPGSPEPLSFDEESGHSVVIAEWDGESWRLEAFDISQWACRSWDFDAADYPSQAKLMERIRALLDAEASKVASISPGVNDTSRLVGRIILRGQPQAGVTFDAQEMSDMLALTYPCVYVEDRTVLSFDLDTLEAELTIRGSFVRRIRTQLEGSAQEPGMQALAHRALSHGLRALEGRKVSL